MYRLFAIIVLAMPFLSFGRDVTGKVVDGDQRPVAFANVVLLCDTVFADGGATDTDDHFIIGNVPECANVLKVVTAGYDTYIGALPGDGNAGTVVINRAGPRCSMPPAPNTRVPEPATRRKEECNN